MDPCGDKPATASTSSTAYIGNLRSDSSAEGLENEVQSLFESIGVTILLEDIKIQRRSTKKPAYGFVNLKDKETFDICVEKLDGFASVDAKEVIFPGMVLEVNVARKNQPNFVKTTPQAKQKSRKRSTRSRKTRTSNSNMKNLMANYGTTATSSVPMTTDCVTMTTGSVTMAKSISNNMSEANIESQNFLLNQQSYLKRPALDKYYYVGQKLGTEDRLTEYKQGGGSYLDLQFKRHIAKYVCAFLNSEGGTLLVGVKDDCTVCGIEVSSRREDLLRLEVDKIMEGFIPPVFTNLYKVNFVPVFPCPETQKSPSSQDVKTVESQHFDISDLLSLNVISDSGENFFEQ